MKRLKVGVWLDQVYTPQAGGGFGYHQRLVEGLAHYSFKNADIVFLTHGSSAPNFKFGSQYQIQNYPCREKFLKRLIRFVFKTAGVKAINLFESLGNEAAQERLNLELSKVVDVIYYPTPMCSVPGFPYIYTVWDLGFESTFAFPEFTANGEFENRLYHHEKLIKKALKVFAESNAGKSELCKYLNITESRIRVVPLLSSDISSDEVKSICPKKVSESEFFIHYPAQYWAHKNHANLLIAFKVVLTVHPNLKLIFTGSNKGNREYVLRMISELGLENAVIDLGFVKKEELKWLYLHSHGLVMPSFLGPTNMPPIEAAELGCPVACSGLSGHIEQLGEYGYYFDPSEASQIANAICDMVKDKKAGIRRRYQSVFNSKASFEAMDSAFTELKKVRQCWG